jgi:hypothetical protein
MKLRNILENIASDDTEKNVQKELRRIASDCGLVATLNIPRETSGGTVYTVRLNPKSSNLEKWTAVDTFNGHVGYGMNESYYDAVFKFWLTVFDVFKDRIDIMIHDHVTSARSWKKVPSVVKISDSWFKDQRNSLSATSFRISKN